jgi:hypothetical protein
MRGENNDVALGCLLLRPSDRVWAKIGDKLSQCLRTSGIGYNHCMTSGYQMAAKRTCNDTCAYKPYSHDQSPFFS